MGCQSKLLLPSPLLTITPSLSLTPSTNPGTLPSRCPRRSRASSKNRTTTSCRSPWHSKEGSLRVQSTKFLCPSLFLGSSGPFTLISSFLPPVLLYSAPSRSHCCRQHTPFLYPPFLPRQCSDEATLVSCATPDRKDAVLEAKRSRSKGEEQRLEDARVDMIGSKAGAGSDDKSKGRQRVERSKVVEIAEGKEAGKLGARGRRGGYKDG